MDDKQRIKDLEEANTRYVLKDRTFAEQLKKDRDQFLFYADNHEKKVPATADTLEKARVNRKMAADIEALLEGH